METIGLSRKEFNTLPERPRNEIIGECWKTKSEDRWFLCEYVPYDDPEYMLIKIKYITILEKTRDDDLSNDITDYWLKYYIDHNSGLCALCGDTGIIHIETVKNPSGKIVRLGYSDYCICPNGRLLRNNNDFKENIK